MKKLALCGAVVLFGGLPPLAHAAPPASTEASEPEAASHEAISPKAGDAVYDKAGDRAGSVESVNGNVVVVATEQGKGSMPLAEFSMGEKGLTLNHTRAELEAAIRTANAAQAPAAQAPAADGAQPRSASR